MFGDVTQSTARYVTGLVALSGIALASMPAAGGVMQTANHDFNHRTFGTDYPEVGRLELANGGTFSGTLIDSRWVVTAAHAVDAARDMTFRNDGGTVRASSWYTHDTWQRDPVFGGNDIALVHLNRPAPDAHVAPRRRKLQSTTEDIWTAGYGATGTGQTGPTQSGGLRYAGENRIDGNLFQNQNMAQIDFDIEPDHPLYDGPNFAVEDFETDLPMTFEYLPALQDGGGGVFADDGTIVGVQSTIFGFFDGETDYSYKDTVGLTRIAPWSDWIDQVIARVESGNFPANAFTGTPGNGIFTEAQALNLTQAQIQQGQGKIGGLTPPNLRSGFFLGPLGSAIPEPGTAALLAPLAGACLWRPRRPRR